MIVPSPNFSDTLLIWDPDNPTIKTWLTLEKELVLAIKNYLGSNGMLFGINSKKKPGPKLVK